MTSAYISLVITLACSTIKASRRDCDYTIEMGFLDGTSSSSSQALPRLRSTRYILPRTPTPISTVIMAITWSITRSTTHSSRHSLVTLPLELRAIIYSYVLSSREPISLLASGRRSANSDCRPGYAILLVNRQTHAEACPLFYTRN